MKPLYEEERRKKIEKARDEAAAAAIELLKGKLAEAAEKERRRLESKDTVLERASSLFFLMF